MAIWLFWVRRTPLSHLLSLHEAVRESSCQVTVVAEVDCPHLYLVTAVVEVDCPHLYLVTAVVEVDCPHLYLVTAVVEVDYPHQQMMSGAVEKTPQTHYDQDVTLPTRWLNLHQLPLGAGTTRETEKTSRRACP
jgi:hypothetical protein